MGLGGGQVVNVLTFYSDDSSSNPANVYSFSSVKLFEKNKNKQKRGWEWSNIKIIFLKKIQVTKFVDYLFFLFHLEKNKIFVF